MPGEQMTPAPAQSDDRTTPTRPWIWKSGMTLRQRSSSVSSSVNATLRRKRRDCGGSAARFSGGRSSRRCAARARCPRGLATAWRRRVVIACIAEPGLEHRQPALLCKLARGGVDVWAGDERAGLKIREVEGELRAGVSRIEGCANSSTGDGEKRSGERRAVRKHDCDVIAPIDPDSAEQSIHLRAVAEEPSVRDRAASRRKCDRIRRDLRPPTDDLGNRARRQPSTRCGRCRIGHFDRVTSRDPKLGDSHPRSRPRPAVQ